MAAADAHFDSTDNGYEIDAQVASALGTVESLRVARFHDGYEAYSAGVEIGLVEQAFAERLTLRAFTSGYDKDLQSDARGLVPYGEVRYGEQLCGLLGTYQQHWTERFSLQAQAAYTYRSEAFEDLGSWVYDWSGAQVGSRGGVGLGGETGVGPIDRIVGGHRAFARLNLEFSPSRAHIFSLGVAPEYSDREGENLLLEREQFDGLSARRRQLLVVSGLEYRARLWEVGAPEAVAADRGGWGYGVENALFVKHYATRVRAEVAGSTAAELVPETGTHFTFGFGDAVQVRLAEGWFAKASYEYATRIPDLDTMVGAYGDSLYVANLKLKPERSHSFNLGASGQLQDPLLGALSMEVNGFVRERLDVVQLLTSSVYVRPLNLGRTRTFGIEGNLVWTSAGRWLRLNGASRYQDQRSLSTEVGLEAIEGERVPRRPWFFASWGADLELGRLLLNDGQRLCVFYQGRYVHGYEVLPDVGPRGLGVPDQTLHSVGLTYGLQAALAGLHATVEVQNLNDAKVYDYGGLERPGRAFYAKLVGEL